MTETKKFHHCWRALGADVYEDDSVDRLYQRYTARAMLVCAVFRNNYSTNRFQLIAIALATMLYVVMPLNCWMVELTKDGSCDESTADSMIKFTGENAR